MKFDVPANYAELSSAEKQEVLNTAFVTLRDQNEVYFQHKKFTNYDELVSFLTSYVKAAMTEADWNGEAVEDYNG